MNERYVVMPYLQEESGEYTISNAAMQDIYATMLNRGRIFNTFRKHMNFKEFLEYFRRKDVFASIVYDSVKSEVVLIAWMSNISETSAFCHYCHVNDNGDAAIGKTILDYWDSLGRLDVLIGVIPSSNKGAIRWIQRLGFKQLGEIPDLISSPKGPATISYYHFDSNREEGGKT